ncbi:ABC transporter ATP-binding protein [Curtobacterium sp. MCPF17_011]|uniref:ATP-binding cassette domain-containing protein n=1 Tax=Curtobacterium sp. MCPF17_011 TaxID=2175652 RepID=UPI000DA9ACF1|nr:ATP-binding cassette domain-containing protein [Curtobacterium sp. MCPF17_011]PZF15309.1 ABC transporter ATP-binding protein [Curtobacterium sp. MCPF17_011]
MIQLRDVGLRGHDRPRLQDVSVELQPGRVYGLVGPNGAGKSTLLAVLAGLVRIDHGALTGSPWQRGEAVGAVFGDGDLHRGRTVRETLLLRARFVGSDRSAVDETARRVGLHAVLGRRVRALSLGMKVRLAIGVALLGSPSLVLFDEPMNGLDPNGIGWLRAVVSDLRNAGVTVVVSSHLLGELETMIDVAVIVSQGRVVRVEPVVSVETEACEVRVGNATDFLEAVAERGIEPVVDGRVVHLPISAAEAVRMAVEVGVDVLSVVPARRSLQALYDEVSTAEFESEVVA